MRIDQNNCVRVRAFVCVCVSVSKETQDVKWNTPRWAKAVGLSWQWKTDDPEPRKGLSASVTSIIPQQICLSLCHGHSDACAPAFTRVQQLRAEGTAKYNTGQRYMFTDVLCSADVPLWCYSCRNVSGRLSNLCFIQTCTFLYHLQYTSVCSESRFGVISSQTT